MPSNTSSNRLTSARPSFEPRPSRYAVDQLVWLVGADGRVSSATMVNVSRDGFGLKVSHPQVVGERIVLRGGAGDVPGEIRWTSGDRAGGVFVQPRYD
jgi:hypothetical protein